MLQRITSVYFILEQVTFISVSIHITDCRLSLFTPNFAVYNCSTPNSLCDLHPDIHPRHVDIHDITDKPIEWPTLIHHWFCNSVAIRYKIYVGLRRRVKLTICKCHQISSHMIRCSNLVFTKFGPSPLDPVHKWINEKYQFILHCKSPLHTFYTSTKHRAN